MNTTTHRAGFVHIIGKPNAGKSTLFNALVQYPLSIISPKPQTTRHNIIGITNTPSTQTIYMDTPGYLEPTYPLQEIMLRNVKRALVESDLLLWVVDVREKEADDLLLKKTEKQKTPCLLLLNKIDLLTPDQVKTQQAHWQQQTTVDQVIPLSAHQQSHVNNLAEQINQYLPLHPPYYDKNILTDRSTRFFTADIIRKALLAHYKQEIPYSTEVIIEHFQEQTDIIHIHTTLHVERQSQKHILIGKKGNALKRSGTTARKELEKFLKKKVFLKQHVKIAPNWRHNKNKLAQWGYK